MQKTQPSCSDWSTAVGKLINTVLLIIRLQGWWYDWPATFTRGTTRRYNSSSGWTLRCPQVSSKTSMSGWRKKEKMSRYVPFPSVPLSPRYDVGTSLVLLPVNTDLALNATLFSAPVIQVTINRQEAKRKCLQNKRHSRCHFITTNNFLLVLIDVNRAQSIFLLDSYKHYLFSPLCHWTLA